MRQQHQLVHRVYVVKVTPARRHWRQSRHGLQHDSGVFTKWVIRDVLRRQDTITNSLVVEFQEHPDLPGAADYFTRHFQAWRADIRIIPGGLSRGLPQRLPLPDHVVIVETVIP